MKIIKHIAIVPALAVLALAMSSCYIRISDEGKQEIRDTYKYKELMREVIHGPEDTLVYSPGEFHALKTPIWVDIIFEQRDGEPEVIVKGSTRVRDSIKVENIDGTLNIYYESRAGVLYTMDEYIKVFAPSLDRIDRSGSGDLTVLGTLRGESLEITSSGSGNLYLEGCEIKGPVSIEKSGSGDTEAKVKCASLKVIASGSGDVDLQGEADEASLEKSGSGDLDASKLKVSKINVIKSGSGDVSYQDGGVMKTN